VVPAERVGGREVKSLLQAIVESLVDEPEAVSIQEVVGQQAHVLELRVARGDVGKVIGRSGAHAAALRTLLAACSGKERRRYILEIVEHETGGAQVTRLPRRDPGAGGRSPR